MSDDWIGFAAITGPIVLLGVYFWFKYRAKQDMQQTIRLALDKGHELSPELIERLGHPKAPKNKDLRLAVIWLAIALALGLCAMIVPEADAVPGILMGAVFPACIGTAYLLIWRFAGTD